MRFMDDAVPRSLLLIVLIVAGGFFSGAETALSFCNRIRMQVLSDAGDKRAQRTIWVLERFDRAVVTLLIAINLIHIIAASMATVMAVRMMGNSGSLVATVVMTLLVFFFSETIPKNIAKVNSDSFMLTTSGILQMFMIILKPIAVVLTGLGVFVKNRFNARTGSIPSVTEDEFASMVSGAEEDGVIDHEESDIIKSAIDFGDILAGKIMTRRENMIAIPANIDRESLKKQLIETKYSRFPVYDGTPDRIIGIARSVRCLWRLMGDGPFDLREYITRPYFVRPDMLISEVFEGMSGRRQHMAIVQDEEGHTLGMLTMEDILEEIVGEIYDEDDSAPRLPPVQPKGGMS